MISYGSVCSGIESVSVAVDRLAWRPDWFAEIEPFPSAVLAHRFPDVPNHGDMTELPVKVLRREIGAPEVLVGGTPCQAFSVAGMRKGLTDPRGALTIKFVELADAIDHVRAADGKQECVVWWENVPGVLSDKGNAFGCLLAALVGESEPLQPSGQKWTDAGCVYGPERTAAWRVLDAQYFGLAQRRRRVFVVASARRGFDPAAVLFEPEGVRRDTPPRRGEGQDIAGRAPFGPAIQCGCGHIYSCDLGVWGCPDCEGEEGPGVEVMSGRPFFGGGNRRGSLFQGATLTAHSGRNDFDSEVFCVYRESRNDIGDSVNAVISETTVKEDPDKSYSVRRLTPIECERLQGFPDDWTKIPWRGRPEDGCPDGPRYKAIGNSKAVPVVRWIAGRIQDHLGR